jgi:hypothetical protein
MQTFFWLSLLLIFNSLLIDAGKLQAKRLRLKFNAQRSPIPDKSFVTAQFLENWNDIKDGHAYVLLTQDDGIVFKVVYNNIKIKKKLLLKSLNFVYEPYEVSIGEIKEVWEFVNYISTQMPESNQSKEEVNKSVTLIQEEMRKIAEVLQRKPQTLLKRKPHAR